MCRSLVAEQRTSPSAPRRKCRIDFHVFIVPRECRMRCQTDYRLLLYFDLQSAEACFAPHLSFCPLLLDCYLPSRARPSLSPQPKRLSLPVIRSRVTGFFKFSRHFAACRTNSRTCRHKDVLNKTQCIHFRLHMPNLYSLWTLFRKSAAEKEEAERLASTRASEARAQEREDAIDAVKMK